MTPKKKFFDILCYKIFSMKCDGALTSSDLMNRWGNNMLQAIGMLWSNSVVTQASLFLI